MKKIILLNMITTSIIFGAMVNPLPANNKAKENGGEMHGIDAYQDGVGVIVLNNEIESNSYLKEFIFKYGESAKTSNTNVIDYILVNQESTNEEKNIAQELKYQNYSEGDNCDDGNIQTINDKYVNGVCVGENVEGIVCNDGNENTVNDKYKNGECIGVINGNNCDDEDINTVNDIYTNGECKGSILNVFLNLAEGTTYVGTGPATNYIPMSISPNTGLYYSEFEITSYYGRTNHYFGIVFSNGTRNIIYRYKQPLLAKGARVSILVDTDNLKVDVYANGNDRLTSSSGNITDITENDLIGMKVFLSNGSSGSGTSYKVLSPSEFLYKPF